MTSLNFHSSVLFVANIELSKTFYTEVLGLKIEQDFGTNISLSNGLSLWQISNKHIILDKDLYNNNNGNKFELYFETDDIKAIQQKLESKNVEFFHDILEEPWGQFNIRFFDPDRHLIEVGEKLETFVSRMFGEGMNINKISDKTGIPVNYVTELLDKEIG